MSGLAGLASAQAATRVNPEKASKVLSLVPTLLGEGEGRWTMGEQSTIDSIVTSRGSWGQHVRTVNEAT